jgi:hypothetical protein
MVVDTKLSLMVVEQLCKKSQVTLAPEQEQ